MPLKYFAASINMSNEIDEIRSNEVSNSVGPHYLSPFQNKTRAGVIAKLVKCLS